MHTHFPSSLDLCALCQIIGGEKGVTQQEFLNKYDDNGITAGESSSEGQPEFDTDTIVIGNGPAGIALSAMLSGWHPFYDDQTNAHPNPEIHQRLSQSPNKSLFFQDLSPLADLSQSELHQNLTPFASLYDSLARPFPADPARRSCLQWRHIPSGQVQHIVLGDSPIGGSWTGYEDETTTVSISSWMDLPGYSLALDFVSNPDFAGKRPNARTFKHYLLAYCLVMGIEGHFRPFTQVSQIQKLCHRQSGVEFWEVRGVQTLTDEPFTLRCRNVVLACGQSHPRMLEVPGEMESNDSLVYDLSALKRSIAIVKTPQHIGTSLPVVVIGDGISAADAVLYCLNRGCPILHVIRRNERQLRNVMLSRLSASIYPEYARIYQLMIGQTVDANYRRMIGARVVGIDGDELTLETSAAEGIIREQFRCLSICIGRRSEPPLLRGSSAQFEFTTNYQSSTEPTLFAIGAIAGDHFVRYLVGGALCVAQTLMGAQLERRQKSKNSQQFRCCVGFPGDELKKTGEQRGGTIQSKNCTGLPRTSSATPLVQLAAAANSRAQKSPMMIGRAKSTMQLGMA